MSIENPKNDSKEHSYGKNCTDKPFNECITAFKSVFGFLHDKGWLPNIACGFLFFIPTILGAYMGTRGLIIGLAVTITLFVWVVALMACAKVTDVPVSSTAMDSTPPPNNQATTFAAINQVPPPATPIPLITVTNGDHIQITAPNNNGTVIGKQINEYGAKRRIISDDQAKQIKAILLKWSPIPISIEYEEPKAESTAYAKRLKEIFESAGYSTELKPITMTGNPPGTYFSVENPSNCPKVAEDLQKLLLSLNIPVIWNGWGGEPGGIAIQIAGNPNE